MSRARPDRRDHEEQHSREIVANKNVAFHAFHHDRMRIRLHDHAALTHNATSDTRNGQSSGDRHRGERATPKSCGFFAALRSFFAFTS